MELNSFLFPKPKSSYSNWKANHISKNLIYIPKKGQLISSKSYLKKKEE